MITLNSSVGIEVRGDELLLVCLKRGFRITHVDGYQVVENYSQMPRGELKRIVGRFFHEFGVKGERVVLGIPRNEVVIRFVTLPTEVKENLDQVIKFQAESYEPSDENGSYYDYVVLEETEGEDGKLSIALVTVARERLDFYLGLFKDLQIPLHGVEVSTFALWNLLLAGHQGELKDNPYLILNFSNGSSELIGVQKKRLSYSRLSSRMKAVTVSDELISDIEDALSTSRIRAESVEKIFVAGQESESAQRALTAEIPDVKPLTSVLNLKVAPSLSGALPSFATPIGLAWEALAPGKSASINLLPQSQRVRHSRSGYVICTILAVCLALLGFAYLSREYYQESAYLAALEQEILALKPQVDEVDDLRRQAQVLEDKIKYLEELFCAHDNNLELLSEMTKLTPDDTYLLYFSNRGGEIMFQGLSQSASALLPILSNSEFMTGVEPQAPFTRDPVSGHERFSLKGRMEVRPCR